MNFPFPVFEFSLRIPLYYFTFIFWTGGTLNDELVTGGHTDDQREGQTGKGVAKFVESKHVNSAKCLK